jgi:phosphatidylinositol-3-phosphatase
MNRVLTAAAFAAVLIVPFLRAAPPRYDHVVIVVEENRTVTQIIGDRVNAPYINSLADGGVKIGSMFAEVHPSQPNYIHLFSGDNQGIVDDDLPPNFSTTPTPTYPFRTSNMGAELIAAGFSFAGYSEEIESAGTGDWADYDPHSATHPDIYYRRKHVPWVNWVAKVSPTPPNQVPPAVNLSFTNFPANYSTLPTVSFVIPNQLHDMHDGSRKQGDDWLRDHLDGYAQWAKTNNSLLIITWDEDDFNGINQIPTILYGAGLREGSTIAGTWTHHNLLRTIEDMYGTTHAGSAAQVRPIIGAFTNDPPLTVRTFRQGVGGYSGAIDSQIWAETPATTYGTNQDLTADLDTSSSIAGNQVGGVLIRFDAIIGPGLTQIPTNAIIHSAKLIMFTPLSPSGADYDSDDSFRVHRMITNWNNNSTWNSLGNGVDADDIEAASSPSFSLVPEVDGAPAIFDVSADIERFVAGTTNVGWFIRPSSTGSGNGWTMRSTEAIDPTERPALEVVYSAFFTPYVTWTRSLGITGSSAEPMADPDRDGLPNLAEYAYNTNPRVPDARRLTPNGTSGTPAPYYLEESGGVLEVDFVRRTTATDLTYHAQFSSDLLNWSDGLAPVVSPINASFDRVRVRDAAAGGAPRRFVRVVLTLQ